MRAILKIEITKEDERNRIEFWRISQDYKFEKIKATNNQYDTKELFSDIQIDDKVSLVGAKDVDGILYFEFRSPDMMVGEPVGCLRSDLGTDAFPVYPSNDDISELKSFINNIRIGYNFLFEKDNDKETILLGEC